MKIKQSVNQEMKKVLVLKFHLFVAWWIVDYVCILSYCAVLFIERIAKMKFLVLLRIIFIPDSNNFRDINSFCKVYERETFDQGMVYFPF